MSGGSPAGLFTFHAPLDRRQREKSMKLLAVGISLFVAINCFGKRREAPPPEPRFAAIGQIVILPVVDSRVSPTVKVDLENMRKYMQQRLRRKNYAVSSSDNTGVGSMALADLQRGDPSWIRRLGPPQARWVMVVAFGGVQVNYRIPSAAVLGFLYDKGAGAICWSGTAVGQYHLSRGPYGPGCGACLGEAASAQLADTFTLLAMPGSARKTAVLNALFDLQASIPKMPKSR